MRPKPSLPGPIFVPDDGFVGTVKKSAGSPMYYRNPEWVGKQYHSEFKRLCAQIKSRLEPKIERQTNSVTAIAKREINSAVSAVRNAGNI